MFQNIPNEMIIEITKYLTYKDIIVLSCCDRHLQSLFTNIYWRNLYTKLNIPILNDIELDNDVNFSRLIVELEDKILLHELNKVSKTNSDVLIYACTKGYIEIVKILITIPIIDPSSSLVNYNLMKHLNSYKFKFALFTDKGMININNYSFIFSACLGYDEIVELLLKHPKVDPTAIDNRSIRWTCRYGHTKVLKTLLKDGRIDPGVRNNYCVRESLENNHKDVTKNLLKSDKIIKTKHGNTVNLKWSSIYTGDCNVTILLDDNDNVLSYRV
uniref:F-box domain and ankyrin repeat protein n=1 Tax=Pithovirus LCPAC101 TaxID=2506586 RepID=A0A481Z5N9_9VIRU|nr:MAG: F-box domain and ankyrin repeat protein [Pithovirus LCPAC101]